MKPYYMAIAALMLSSCDAPAPAAQNQEQQNKATPDIVNHMAGAAAAGAAAGASGAVAHNLTNRAIAKRRARRIQAARRK